MHTITPDERSNMLHALGLTPPASGPAYRNRFWTDPESDDAKIWAPLVGEGLAVVGPPRRGYAGMVCFMVTVAGMDALGVFDRSGLDRHEIPTRETWNPQPEPPAQPDTSVDIVTDDPRATPPPKKAPQRPERVTISRGIDHLTIKGTLPLGIEMFVNRAGSVRVAGIPPHWSQRGPNPIPYGRSLVLVGRLRASDPKPDPVNPLNERRVDAFIGERVAHDEDAQTETQADAPIAAAAEAR
jgi:hypothetical protein